MGVISTLMNTTGLELSWLRALLKVIFLLALRKKEIFMIGAVQKNNLNGLLGIRRIG